MKSLKDFIAESKKAKKSKKKGRRGMGAATRGGGAVA